MELNMNVTIGLTERSHIIMNRNLDLAVSETPSARLLQKIEQYQEKKIAVADMVKWATAQIYNLLSEKRYPLDEMEIYPLLCDLMDSDGDYDQNVAHIKRALLFEENFTYAFTICFDKNPIPEPIALLTAYIRGDKLQKEEVSVLDDFINNTPINPTTLKELLEAHLQLLLKTSLFFEDDDILFEIGNAICPSKEDYEFDVFKKRVQDLLLCYCGEKSFHAAVWFRKGIHWSIIF